MAIRAPVFDAHTARRVRVSEIAHQVDDPRLANILDPEPTPSTSRTATQLVPTTSSLCERRRARYRAIPAQVRQYARRPLESGQGKKARRGGDEDSEGDWQDTGLDDPEREEVEPLLTPPPDRSFSQRAIDFAALEVKRYTAQLMLKIITNAEIQRFAQRKYRRGVSKALSLSVLNRIIRRTVFLERRRTRSLADSLAGTNHAPVLRRRKRELEAALHEHLHRDAIPEHPNLIADEDAKLDELDKQIDGLYEVALRGQL
ncbi:hypothetical protein BKA62DRAFT_680835, partial [Auriculariales sp. MPI-PUGE-AT-0066]